jgi:hypothetical protein
LELTDSGSASCSLSLLPFTIPTRSPTGDICRQYNAVALFLLLSQRNDFVILLFDGDLLKKRRASFRFKTMVHECRWNDGLYLLDDFERKFPRIPQHAWCWCIPACIENVLKFIGFSEIDQELLVLEYCEEYKNESLLTTSRQPIAIQGRTKDSILDLARQCVLKNASFGSFKACTEKLCHNWGYTINFDLSMGIHAQQDYLDKARSFIQEQSPVLISANNLDGTYHISVVVGFEDEKLYFFDPALNDFRLHGLDSLVFSSDMLRLVL